VSFPLIQKLDKLKAMMAEGSTSSSCDLVNDPKVMLKMNDNMLDLLEEIVDAAGNEFGHNVPSPRIADTMASRGYPVRLKTSENVAGRIPTIFTPMGMISYR
jgi:hypothetical protein